MNTAQRRATASQQWLASEIEYINMVDEVLEEQRDRVWFQRKTKAERFRYWAEQYGRGIQAILTPVLSFLATIVLAIIVALLVGALIALSLNLVSL